MQVSASVDRFFKNHILVCKRVGDHEKLSSAEEYLEERNLTGKLDDSFSMTEQDTDSNLHILRVWL